MDFKMLAYGLVCFFAGILIIAINVQKAWKSRTDEKLSNSQLYKDLIGYSLYSFGGLAVLALSVGLFIQALPSNQTKPDRMAILKTEYDRVLKATGSQKKAMESMERMAKEMPTNAP